MIRRLRPAFVLAALAVGAAACSGDDGTNEPARSTTTTEASTDPTPDGEDECAWLAPEDVTTALGRPMALTAAGPGGCFFDAEGETGPSVQVSSIEIAIDVDEYVAGSQDLCQGPVVDVDHGDTAWACRSTFGPQGIAVFGATMVVADVKNAADDVEGLELAAQVAAVLTAG